MAKEFLLGRAVVLACCFNLAAVSPSRADVLPWGHKNIKPRLQFTGIEKYADNVFFLRYTTRRNPVESAPQFRELENSEPFDFLSGRISSMHVLAMNRAEFNRRMQDNKAPNAALSWLDEKVPGIFRAQIEPPKTSVPIEASEVSVTVYEVTITAGQLSAEMLTSRGWLSATAVGFSSAFAIGFLGIWLTRRRRLSAKAGLAPNKESAQT